MASILALLSSLLWGTADFLGGNLSKKFHSLAVTGASQAIGLIVGATMILVSGSYISPNLSWNGYFLPAIGAGIAGFAGLTAFYAGLATGRMGVVSPISSLSAIIPLTYAFIQGERPHVIQFFGMAVALIGAFCASGPEIIKGLITWRGSCDWFWNSTDLYGSGFKDKFTNDDDEHASDYCLLLRTGGAESEEHRWI